MGLCWLRIGEDQAKICPTYAPGRTAGRKMFCGNASTKSGEQKLSLPLNPALYADKCHACERHVYCKQGNDGK
jgi:hypothetical protein